MALTIRLPLERIVKDMNFQTKQFEVAWSNFKTAIMEGEKQQIRKTLDEFHEKASDTLFPSERAATQTFQKKYPVYWLARESILQDECHPPDETYTATGSHTTTSIWNFTDSQSNIAHKAINNLEAILGLDTETKNLGNDEDSYIMKVNGIVEKVLVMVRQLKDLPDVLQKLTDIKHMLSTKSTDHQPSSETNSADEKLSHLKNTAHEIWQIVCDITKTGKPAPSPNTTTNRSSNGRMEKEQLSGNQHEMVTKHEMIVELQHEIAQLQQSEQKLKNEVQRCEADKKEIMRSRSDNEKSSRHMNEMAADPKEIASLQREITSLKDKDRRLTEALQSAELDKNYWMSRVSEVTGTKLKHNNPGITDLSDPNRPQKLAEQYGELYDNEWTEALEKLTKAKVDDKQAVVLLCKIIKESYEKCEVYAKKQIYDIERHFLGAKAGKKQNTGQDENVSFKKALKDAQRAMSDAVRTTVIKEIQGQMVKCRGMPESFITSSLRICWGMVAQDPPLVFLYPECGKDKKIDMDSFTLYTRSGEGIEIVVWPAMLLHKGGAVLRKGVVQPYKKK